MSAEHHAAEGAAVGPAHHHTHHLHHRRQTMFGSILFTIVLLGSIALAIREMNPGVAVLAPVAAVLLVAAFHVAFRESDLFSLVFANAVGVYACLFAILASVNFPAAKPASLDLAFVLPLFTFGTGVLVRRRKIEHLLATVGHERTVAFRGSTLWIGPLAIVAILTTFMRVADWSADSQDGTLLIAMGLIASVAWASAARITVFLMETGSVFRSFLVNAAKLSRPAFALLTCYSLFIIFFGCVYTIFDEIAVVPNFATLGEARTLTFVEGLYLSVATLSMVGFGDVTPLTIAARLLVSIEILCGILLLLFGVEAMLERGRAK
jgi:voltage-gated potassium channel